MILKSPLITLLPYSSQRDSFNGFLARKLLLLR